MAALVEQFRQHIHLLRVVHYLLHLDPNPNPNPNLKIQPQP